MIILLIVLTIASFCLAQFSNPPADRATWKVGDVQNISFKTEFTTFSIALWQQAPDGGSATLGPIVFQTVNNAATQFTWLVQAYDFDLAISDVFFFWMFEGDPSLQGNQSSPQMSSAFFNLSNETTDSTTTEASPSSTSAFQAATQETTQSTTPAPSSSTIDQPGEIAQHDSVQKESGDLSSGAKAGIGISIGLVGLIIIMCVGLYIRKLKKQAVAPPVIIPQPFPQPIPQKEVWQAPPVVEIDTVQRSSHAELP
ncbi:hypothetical protein F4774DRAFT_379624 [Daldinia eschscholtzii]|nr:hypothetical protein F4774DRAFT_379624 [Daldinia eschscholtzii]